MRILDNFLRKAARRQDDEWKQAVDYGFKHFQGKELEKFLRIVDNVDEERLAETKKLKKSVDFYLEPVYLMSTNVYPEIQALAHNPAFTASLTQPRFSQPISI